MIIGLQGQYDINVGLSGTRSYIYLAMRLDHGDFRSTPVNGHSQDRRACLKGATNGHSIDLICWRSRHLEASARHLTGNAVPPPNFEGSS